MNTSVSATGMQVVAKTDDTFLLISNTKTAAAGIQQDNLVAVDIAMTDLESQLYASAPCLTADEAALLPATTGKQVGETPIVTAAAQVTDAATADVYTNWYTAKAENASASTMKTGSARQLTTFAGYVVKKTVYLTVAAGANPANNLRVTPTFTQKTGGNDITAARVLITTGDGAFKVLKSTDSGNVVDIKGDNHDITDSTVLVVNIYIYYDGNDSKVFTNNAANLAGATISLKFDVDANPTA